MKIAVLHPDMICMVDKGGKTNNPSIYLFTIFCTPLGLLELNWPEQTQNDSKWLALMLKKDLKNQQQMLLTQIQSWIR